MSGSTSSFQDVSVGSGPDAIRLQLSEDAYLGDAQFVVSVDGQQIGSVQTASASHANHETQSLTVLGSFGPGAHSVAVDFLNDLYGGTPDSDRNLYVDSIASSGATSAGAVLYGSGPYVFQISGAASVSDSATLNVAIDAANAATAGNVVITFANGIIETAALHAINLQPGVTLTIDGQGNALDGAGAFRGLFAYAGTITVQNLAIDNTVALGGKGGSEGAGGGAGLGGGLFVAGANPGLSSGAAVTLKNVAFSNNKAIGGAGNGGGGQFEGNLGAFGSNGGGGGLGGDGGNYSLNGGGGGGIGGNGGTASAGDPGIVSGAPSAGSGSPPTFDGAPPEYPGGINAGGGGSTRLSSFGAGGGGGAGGAPGSATADSRVGGAGGFGGGGGGGSTGGDGGVGGGGGSPGGNGGFGGGGADKSRSGGFGAGAGSAATSTNGFLEVYDGGGGLGAGGAIFVQAGGNLVIDGGQLSGGSVAGGVGGTGFQEGPAPAIRNGQGLGSGIFLQGDQTLVLSQAATAGQVTLISDVIADQSGSGGTGANAGAGKVSIAGPGTVVLGATNTYTGGTLISGGTLDLAAAGAAGSGPIGFTGGAAATLQLSEAALPDGSTFSNSVAGFGGVHLLDFAGLVYARDAQATILGHTLTVSSNGVTDRLTLSDIDYPTPVQVTTSAGGRGEVLVSATPVTGNDIIALKVSEDAFEGDAQYTISVDGTSVGGVRTATASHAAGATEDVAITGNFGPGAHKIGIAFLNDAYDGTPQTDRNLYVDSLSFDGRPSVPATATLYSTGTTEFAIPSAASTTKLTLLLAEDAYQGDAQYSVAVDGLSAGPVGLVSASNAEGQTQAVDIVAALAAGVHDVALSFLNDAYGGTPSTDRNLYLKGLEVNGAPVQGVFSTGTEHFSITVPQL